MAGINFGGVGESHDFIAEAAGEVECVAAGEVGAANGLLEEVVAREKDSFFLAIETDAARGVAWCLDYFEAVVAKGDGVAFFEHGAEGCDIDFKAIAEHALHLKGEVGVELCIVGMHLGLEAIGGIEMSVAHGVVKVGVSVEYMLECQSFSPYIFIYCLMFATYTCAVVDDDGFFGFIADDIAVFFYHVDHKTFDV